MANKNRKRGLLWKIQRVSLITIIYKTNKHRLRQRPFYAYQWGIMIPRRIIVLHRYFTFDIAVAFVECTNKLRAGRISHELNSSFFYSVNICVSPLFIWIRAHIFISPRCMYAAQAAAFVHSTRKVGANYNKNKSKWKKTQRINWSSQTRLWNWCGMMEILQVAALIINSNYNFNCTCATFLSSECLLIIELCCLLFFASIRARK